jgi:hypothetical protein
VGRCPSSPSAHPQLEKKIHKQTAKAEQHELAGSAGRDLRPQTRRYIGQTRASNPGHRAKWVEELPQQEAGGNDSRGSPTRKGSTRDGTRRRRE